MYPPKFEVRGGGIFLFPVKNWSRQYPPFHVCSHHGCSRRDGIFPFCFVIDPFCHRLGWPARRMRHAFRFKTQLRSQWGSFHTVFYSVVSRWAHNLLLSEPCVEEPLKRKARCILRRSRYDQRKVAVLKSAQINCQRVKTLSHVIPDAT